MKPSSLAVRAALRPPRTLARHVTNKQQLGIRSSSTVAAQNADIKPLTSVLIANRGEIALRVGRTASEYGVRTTTLYTDPDAKSQHALSSPFAVNLGDATAYLNGDKIIEVAKREGCDSIHPGYGFLSENSAFARSCVEAGIVFIGPPWEAIEAMGNKSRSKKIMTEAGVPCIPGYHGNNQDPAFLQQQAEEIGFPVLLKAVKGGGGKGMRISQSVNDFADQLASAKSEATNSFGDETMLVEKYITTPRHIEVQVFADKHGNCLALGERDCSLQRRHQKIIEESPAPQLDDKIRKDLWEKARAAALAVNYEGAGTVEFIFDNDTGEFFFMEMNTRLQVEHPVTEVVTGLDLVQWQLMVAEGRPLPITQDEVEARIAERGWGFEARIYAENPDMNFVPDSGKLLHLRLPQETATVRVDAGFVEGDEISSFYDPMIAKLIVQGPTRQVALQKLHAALEAYEVAGPITNIEFLKSICVNPDFMAGDVETGFIEKHRSELFERKPIEPEVWAQAALGLYLQEVAAKSQDDLLFPAGTALGFGSGYQARQLQLVEAVNPGADAGTPIEIALLQKSPTAYDITVNGQTYHNVAASLVSRSCVEAYYPHTRLETTVIPDEDKVTVFQQGKLYKLQQVTPKWVEKALGSKSVANSVLAPMPCKVLRVEVGEGDAVAKDQPLVVIESMKMETVIRSPQHGKISRVVHKAGDICKAGTALVEFDSEATG